MFVLLLSYIAFKLAEGQTGAFNVDIVGAVGTPNLEYTGWNLDLLQVIYVPESGFEL